MEVKCYRTETYHVHALIELERIEGKGVRGRVLMSPFFNRNGIGRSGLQSVVLGTMLGESSMGIS